MRPNPSLYLAFVVGLATGCTELDDPPVWVEFDYQVRCVDCVPKSFNDDPHNIGALDGDDGLNVTCTSEGDKITVQVTYDQDGTDEDWGFRLDSADVSEGGPGNGCTITVRESASEYRGACTADAPTTEAPCQVKLTHDDYLVSGTILCENIPNRVEKTVTRHVTKPGSDTMPFAFEVQNCEGL